MLKKISLVTIGNMFNAFLGFIFLWAVANALPIEQFGKYSLFISLMVIIGRLTDFGTNSTFVANSILSKTKKSTLIYTKIVLTGTALIIGFSVLALLNLLTLKLSLIFTGGVVAYSLSYLLYAFYQREERYTLLVLLYTIPALIKAASAPFFYFKLINPSVEMASAIFGLSIFSGCFLLINSNPLKNIKLNLSKENLILLKNSWPAGISQTINEVWSALSNSIAKIISGFADVGIFSLASKVSVVFSLLSLSIFTVLLPKNAKRKKQELKYSFDEAALLAMLLLVMGIVGVISSRFVISTFFGPQFKGSLELLNILVFAAALTSISAFMENYFFIEQDPKKILIINTSKLATFLLSVLILTPSLKLQGLAYAQLFAAIAALIITGKFIFFSPQKGIIENVKDKLKNKI